ncbi:hypothetical protein FHG87_023987, partial [Trinorchestia longiramus]
SHTTAMGFTEVEAVVMLYNLLTPKECRLIDTLPAADRFKLPEIKLLLLDAHKVTPAKLRANYYDLKPEEGDNMSRYLRRLEQVFDAWLKGCNVEANYETLRDFLLVDRAYSSLPPFLATQLRDRGGNTVALLGEQGDSFLQARPHTSLHQLCKGRTLTSTVDAGPPALKASLAPERRTTFPVRTPSTPARSSDSSNNSRGTPPRAS